MADLSYASRGAWFAERARQRIQRLGRTPNGHQVWTAREDAIFRELLPDYRTIKRKLRRRSMQSLYSRASYLGLAPKRRTWSASDVSRLRRMWRDAPRAEILAVFPTRTWMSIEHKSRIFGIRRRPWKPKTTGQEMLDAIRARAADLRISLRDLDRICVGRRYFEKSSARSDQPRRNVLLRAIKALGGRVEIVWR